MPKISVIVPVYNTEKYLGRCIDSILAQTFTDFELLLVDDGSTDKSGAICDEYAAKDARIRVFHKQNGGVSSARNLGIDNAIGELMCFIDSDDDLPSQCFETHINLFGAETDMTLGGFAIYSEDGNQCQSVTPQKTGIVTAEECLRDFTPNGNPEWQRYLWNRMFRTSLIIKNKLRFDESIFYKEDGLFIVQYLTRCTGNVMYTDNNVYNYRQNPTSAMGKIHLEYTPTFRTNITAHCRIIKEMRRFKIDNTIIDKEIVQAFWCRSWVLNTFKISGHSSPIRYLSTLVEIYLAISIKKSIQLFTRHCQHCPDNE